MLQDVAMPYVAAGEPLEAHDYPDHYPGRYTDRILPSAQIRLRPFRRSGKLQHFALLVDGNIKWPAIEDLKPDQMDVNRMSILSQVDQATHLGRIDHRILGGRCVTEDAVKQHQPRADR